MGGATVVAVVRAPTYRLGFAVNTFSEVRPMVVVVYETSMVG